MITGNITEVDLKDLGYYWEGSGNDDDNELMITKPDESDENDLLEAGILSIQNLVHHENCKMFVILNDTKLNSQNISW